VRVTPFRRRTFKPWARLPITVAAAQPLQPAMITDTSDKSSASTIAQQHA
jgi:hypothetical protein